MSRWLTAAGAHPEARPGGAGQPDLKAVRELAGIGLDAEDAVAIVSALRAADSAGRIMSTGTGEWLYVFKPRVAGALVYLKLAVRTNCIVVSFHADEEGDHGDQDA